MIDPRKGPAAVALPARARIEAAVRLATERFVQELASPGASAPGWSEFEWTMARAAAVLHGVTPLLACAWQGPDHWVRFATEQVRQTAVRQRRMRRALALIDRQARHAGLPFVALKGSALHAIGLYRSGQRPMADIDLLVSPAQATRMRQLLGELGFQEVAAIWKHRIFEAPPPHGEHVGSPFGERADAPLKIELHDHIAERLPARPIDITDKIWPGNPRPGLNAYPSQVALLLHLLLHAAGNMVDHGLRLIHLHDLALMALRMEVADWDWLITQRLSGMPPWWALPPLELVERYYPGRVPPPILMKLRSLCPRSLRRRARRQSLSDTSYCALRVRAFPGLSWAITATGKLDYLRKRLWLDRESRHGRTVSQRQTWATDNSWVGRQSQVVRIMRWVLCAPIRPAPLYVIRLAISDQAARAAPAPPLADDSGVAAQTP
ncbi:MAG TPA: nucleotidyltransferase family protein [Steroidobacteraceae bacterium]|nr:nucleotidyltransferase family protein [Steroidobacteraceae bacterium]